MSAAGATKPFDFHALAKAFNSPTVTIGAVIVALFLGATRHPLVQHLRPIGDLYLALLQMCVLPFLLVTIPLAVRSALAGNTGATAMRAIVVAIAAGLVIVAAMAVLIPSVIFGLTPIDEQTFARIGALVGSSIDRVDVEFALDVSRGAAAANTDNSGMITLVPTNIFASLSGNNSVQVLVFAAIFGLGMVSAERRSAAILNPTPSPFSSQDLLCDFGGRF